MGLAATIACSTLGGPPALAAVHPAVTAALLGAGAYAATAAFKLAVLLPYTPAALALTAVIKNPPAYITAGYLVAAAEAAIAAALLLWCAGATRRQEGRSGSPRSMPRYPPNPLA